LRTGGAAAGTEGEGALRHPIADRIIRVLRLVIPLGVAALAMAVLFRLAHEVSGAAVAADIKATPWSTLALVLGSH